MTTSTSEITCPIPTEAIGELEQRLNRSLAGWDEKAPRFVSPVPEIEGMWFDVDAVIRVINVLRKLPHTKGRWAGTAFDPAPWQIVWFLGPVFGWKGPDGLRIIQEVWLEVPRKAGKSSIASRCCMYLLAADREMGAEVYAAATSDAQARQVFGEGQTVARRSAALRGKLDILNNVIRVPATGGIFRVLSKVAETAHGLNVSGGVIDEVHLHKKRDLIDAIETGTAARSQPLIIEITTAGTDDETTIYAEKHGYAIQLAEGKAKNSAVWTLIWCADIDDDPFSPVTWAKANPNYPTSPTHAYLTQKAEKAKVRPSFLPTFKRLHLNVRGEAAAESWEGARHWTSALGSVPLEKVKGKRLWAGLVCSTSADLSAIATLWRNPEGKGYWCAWRWFLPEDSLDQLLRRTDGAAQAWVDDKRIELTDGNVIDVERHADELRSLAKTYDIQELAYDPNGAVGVISPLMSELGDKLIPLYATNPSSSLLDWERLLAAGEGKTAEFSHGGDPVAAWQVGHLRVKESATKIIRIDRRASTENVCGIAAAELALRRALLTVDKPKAVLHGASF